MDDLVSAGDEGRGKQRYASGSRKQALIRRSPNGATPSGSSPRILTVRFGSDTQGTETSNYLVEKKTIRDSPSSGERKGKSLNSICVKPECVANRGLWGFRGGEFGPLAE